MESDYSHYLNLKSVTGLTLGTLLLAVGINLFIAPHNLAFGGVTDLTIIIQSLTGVPLAASNLALSVVVMLVGWRILGKAFFVKTVIPTLATPLFLWLTSGLTAVVPNIIISVIFGAVTMGIGIGVVMGVGGSTAGTDTIALALNKRFKTPVKPAMQIVDIAVILCGFAVYGWKTALCSVVVAIVMAETVSRAMKITEKWAVTPEK